MSVCSQPDPSCKCERNSHSEYGPVKDDERLVRILTDKHYRKSDCSLLPTAFNLKDIRSSGVSLVRIDKIKIAEFQEIAENIKCLSHAKAVEGALTAKASLLRARTRSDNARELCVVDDPVRNEPNVRPNEAHCIAVSSVEIDELDAKEIRDRLLTEFSEARYLSDIYRQDMSAASRQDNDGEAERPTTENYAKFSSKR